MTQAIAPQYTQIALFWTAWKVVHAAHAGNHRYSDDGVAYTIYFYDEPEVIVCTIWKGLVPDGIVEGGYSQAQNDADKADFEANFQATANHQLVLRDANGVPKIFLATPQANQAARVAIAPSEGSETIYSTHNFCDKTTWFAESVRVTEEALTSDGAGLVWASAHTHWIDVTSGKIQDEEGLIEEEASRTPGHHGWRVVVTADAVELEMREPLESEGGDYEVNYATGEVTMFVGRPGVTVLASYSYAAGSGWRLKPMPGKVIELVDAETQFSLDVDMTDTIMFTVKGPIDIFAPQYLQSNGGPYPPGTMIPLQTQMYKRFAQLVDEARGAYPVIPPIGGTRGLSQAMHGFPFQYSVARLIQDSLGLELWISLKHDRAFGGARATATFYCSSRAE